MDVALWKVFNVGELQVQLGQPHQHALPGAFKLLPLAGKILKGKEKDDTDDMVYFIYF